MTERPNAHAVLKAHDAEVYEALAAPEVFADLFNGSLFAGTQVIRPEMLSQINEKALAGEEGQDKKRLIAYRIRDSSRSCGFSEGLLQVMLGVEGQRMADYGMPVRMLMYDAIAYARQVKALSKRNRREKRLRRGAEFLSGIKKEDRLIPVLSLVFYYGEDQDWDGALSLHDMLEFPEELKAYQKYFSDYRINLVSSRTVNSGSFHTGLREVFELLKVMGDKEGLQRLLEEQREHYSRLDLERGELIACFLDIKLPAMGRGTQTGKAKGKEKVDMCTAIQELIREGEEKGERKGKRKMAENVLKELFNRGFSAEEGAAVTCLELREVQSLFAQWHPGGGDSLTSAGDSMSCHEQI